VPSGGNINQYDRNDNSQTRITLTENGEEDPNGAIYKLEISSDGRLSLTNGTNAANNKFAFIDIVPR
jgi:hypothetical protein